MLALLAALALTSSGLAAADLSLSRTKDCGQITCDYLYYCSRIDNSCQPCRKVCEPGGRQDVGLCNDHCQDYIHDMRYLRKDQVVDDAKEQTDRLQVLSTISLIFSLLAFVCLVLIVILLLFNKQTKLNVFRINSHVGKTKKPKTPDVITLKRDPDRVQMTGDISTIKLSGQGETVLNIHDLIGGRPVAVAPVPAPHLDDAINMTTFKNHHAKSEPDSASSIYTNKTNKTSQQPLAKRLPSEDSTLDFIYDNPALAPSPVLESGKETTNSTSSGGKKTGSDSDT